MKLVDILARELKAWPKMTEGGTRLEQDINNAVIEGDGCGTVDLFMLSERADDQKGAHVSKSEWQAAVDALNAPKVVEWDGEGYPLIGLFCEYRGTESGIWSGCEIVATRNNAWVVLGDGYETDFVTLESLRPRRTAEQVAAEENRSGGIEEIHSVLLKRTGISNKDAVVAFYDAQYRKVAK